MFAKILDVKQTFAKSIYQHDAGNISALVSTVYHGANYAAPPQNGLTETSVRAYNRRALRELLYENGQCKRLMRS